MTGGAAHFPRAPPTGPVVLEAQPLAVGIGLDPSNCGIQEERLIVKQPEDVKPSYPAILDVLSCCGRRIARESYNDKECS
jgi:hypothetical protein